MADIIVTDVTPRVQYTAGAGNPTVFSYPFPIFANTDLNVYRTPVGSVPNDVTQILVYNVDYTVTNSVPPTVGGTITLTVGANMGDIITIARNQPDNRLNNYIDGGLFEATDVNTDFDRTVFMAQQNKMYDQVLGLHYNVCDEPVVINDTVLPVLGANEIWAKNNANTAIIAIPIPSGGGGGGSVNSVTASSPLASSGGANPNITLNSSVPVSLGGTGDTSFTAYSIILAGTTSTGAFQNVSGVGTSGQVLTSNGAGMIPSWQNASSGTVTAVTASSPLASSGGNTPNITLNSAVPVTLGGTGDASFAAYSVVCGGTTSTGALQNVSGLGSSGQVLTSNGAAALPTWQNTGNVSSVTASSPLASSGGNTPNITLNSAVPVTLGGTGDTSFTAYSVILGGTTSTGNLQNVSGLGNTGQVLTSNGPGAAPTWQASGGGGGGGGISGPWVFISSQSANNSSNISFTGLSNTYLNYMIVMNDVIPATNAVNMQMQFGTGGTPTYQTTAYYWSIYGFSAVGSTETDDAANQSQFTLTNTTASHQVSNGTGAALSGNILIHNPSQSASYHSYKTEFEYLNSGTDSDAISGGGIWHGTTAVTAAKIFMSSGNITSGTFTLYGLLASSGAGTGTPGALNYLASATANSSAFLQFSNLFSSNYDQYIFELVNVIPSTNAVTLQAQIGTGGGPTYITANYGWGVFGGEQNGGYQNNMNASDTLIQITAPSARTNALVSSSFGVSGNVNVFGTNGSNNTTQGSGQLGFMSSAGFQIEEMLSFSQPAATITAIKFFFSSGNIASGTIRMYGVSNGTGTPSASPIPWIDQTATSANLVANTGYITDNGSLVTLSVPATVPFGTVYYISGKGAGGWKIQFNTGQTCTLGSATTSSAGSLASNNQYDSVAIVCTASNTQFNAFSAIGNITVA